MAWVRSASPAQRLATADHRHGDGRGRRDRGDADAHGSRASVTTITESAPPAGFTLTSIACSGLGAGGTATPNLGAHRHARCGGNRSGRHRVHVHQHCPTRRRTGAPAFSFTGTNGFAPQTIATVTPGGRGRGDADARCSRGSHDDHRVGTAGLGAGGTATPNIATRTVTLDAARCRVGDRVHVHQLLPAGRRSPLSEWAMILLAGLMAIAGFAALRGRKQL